MEVSDPHACTACGQKAKAAGGHSARHPVAPGGGEPGAGSELLLSRGDARLGPELGTQLAGGGGVGGAPMNGGAGSGK